MESQSDSQKLQLKEKTAKVQSFIQDQEIYLFIEAKVREVSCKEIENLKSQASTSHANETIKTLESENDTLTQRLRKMESHYTSMKEEAKKTQR